MKLLAAASAVLLAAASPAAAQVGKRDPQAQAPAASQPQSMTEGLGSNPISLAAGFADDPQAYEVVAGGEMNTAELFGEFGCRGMSSDDTSLTLDYQAGQYNLHISALADSDTTLIIGTPNGTVLCDDDSGGGLNPYVTISNPTTGRYLVWLAAYGSDANARVPGTLFVSEIGSAQAIANLLSGGAAGGAAATIVNESSTTLPGGFMPDPYAANVTAGGDIDVSTAFSQCRGWVSDPSNFLLEYGAGAGYPLIFSATSGVDTTLVIESPDGQVHCDDDGGNAPLSPSIRFDAPQAGTYNVWVGTYSQGAAGTAAVLYISEATSQ